MAKAPRCYYPDEEPEEEWVSLELHGEGCGYCGIKGHDFKECPTRPLVERGK